MEVIVVLVEGARSGSGPANMEVVLGRWTLFGSVVACRRTSARSAGSAVVVVVLLGFRFSVVIVGEAVRLKFEI